MCPPGLGRVEGHKLTMLCESTKVLVMTTDTASISPAASLVQWLKETEANDDLTERIRLAIELALLECPDGGWVDSDRIVKVVWEGRVSRWEREGGIRPDQKQTNDYTKFVLREAAHFCRHALDHHSMRLLHIEAECSELCKRKYLPYSRRYDHNHGTCPSCFLRLPATGVCGNCS